MGTDYVYAPRTFKRALGNKNDIFRGMDQHDSQEFIQTLLDGLHEGLSRVIKKPYVNLPKFDD